MDENDQRMLGNAMSPVGLAQNNLLKQCRSMGDLDSRDDGIKIARTDSYGRQSSSEMRFPINSGSYASSGLAYRNNNNSYLISSDSRLSDEGIFGGDPSLAADLRLMRNSPRDSIMPPPYLTSQASAMRHSPYQSDLYQYKSAGLPLLMGRDNHSSISHMMHETAFGARYPFSPSQWAELEHQALIFKYMMARVPIPPELLSPIRRSVATMNGLSFGSPHGLTNLGWGAFQLGGGSNVDAEPGRCRRTDGKKWRCSRPVVQEQKYCERHMHRGRHRSKKGNESQPSTSSAPTAAATSSSNATPSSSSVASRNSSQNSGLTQLHNAPLEPIITMNSQQSKSFAASQPSSSILVDTSSGSLECSQYQIPFQSASESNKDNRFMNGISKTHYDVRPEQLIHWDMSGSRRELGHEAQPSAAMLNGQFGWQWDSSKVCQSNQLKLNSNPLIVCDSQTNKALQNQDFGQTSRVNPLMDQQNQYISSSRHGGIELLNMDRKPESQALRHFFDDWPRPRDSSTLSWSDTEEDKSRNGSNIKLSISRCPASELHGSPNRNKTLVSALKLSMDSAGETDIGLRTNNDHHRQSSWFPVGLENAMGGPLAEVLQSGTPHLTKNVGLNLLGDGWDSNGHDSSQIPSPTGVLQKTAFGCFSDSSSSASSPGSVKTEAVHAPQNAC